VFVNTLYISISQPICWHIFKDVVIPQQCQAASEL
jgi:hypothetical protein